MVELDARTQKIVARTARLFLAQWEEGTPLGHRLSAILAESLQATGGEDALVVTEFYRRAFQDPEIYAAFRRSVATALHLEWGVDLPGGTPLPPSAER